MASERLDSLLVRLDLLPRFPDLFEDANSSAGRFNLRPAIAVMVGEEVWNVDNRPAAEEVIRQEVGSWVLEDHPALGPADAVDGSAGRGAEGWIAVLQWLGEAIANNVVEVAIGAAFADLLHRVRRSGKEGGEGAPRRVEVSRGAAVLLAAAALGAEFEEEGPLEVEAVEEPSAIAGVEVTELSYVGVEPWIVLLRNREAEVRYIVVVMPDGTIAGQLRVPFLPFEKMFMRPSTFGDGS